MISICVVPLLVNNFDYIYIYIIKLMNIPRLNTGSPYTYT